jgi:hypothetical protein
MLHVYISNTRIPPGVAEAAGAPHHGVGALDGSGDAGCAAGQWRGGDSGGASSADIRLRINDWLGAPSTPQVIDIIEPESQGAPAKFRAIVAQTAHCSVAQVEPFLSHIVAIL